MVFSILKISFQFHFTWNGPTQASRLTTCTLRLEKELVYAEHNVLPSVELKPACRLWRAITNNKNTGASCTLSFRFLIVSLETF